MNSAPIRLPHDGHTHPYQVHRDARGPEEFAQTASDKGLPGISFTEHAPLWIPTGSHFLTEGRLASAQRRLARRSPQTPSTD